MDIEKVVENCKLWLERPESGTSEDESVGIILGKLGDEIDAKYRGSKHIWSLWKSKTLKIFPSKQPLKKDERKPNLEFCRTHGKFCRTHEKNPTIASYLRTA